VVVGEMFGGSEGIGLMVNYGGQTFQTDAVFLGVVIIAFAGIVLTWLAEQVGDAASRAGGRSDRHWRRNGRIVLGIGSSHGPLFRRRPSSGICARRRSREQEPLVPRQDLRLRVAAQARAPGFAHEITVEKRRERFVKCRTALEALGSKFNEVAPDAVVILGNDQREFFNAGLTPAITIYRGRRSATCST
jgi:hypothetical protein